MSVILDLASSHYPRWRGQVLLTLRRYALDDHVLDDVTTPPSRAWSLMDSVVLSWLHGTITVELQDIIRDLGEPVADRTLVLNLLRGLSPRYGHLKALIKRTVPFPTFHHVRNELLLEELTMAYEAPAPAPTLYNAPPGGQAPSGGQAPRPPSTGAPNHPTPAVPAAPRQASASDGSRRSRKGGRGGGGSSRGGPPVGVAARRGRHFITPGLGPSPCGRARPHVPPVSRRRPS
jgi:hypothetical protein